MADNVSKSINILIFGVTIIFYTLCIMQRDFYQKKSSRVIVKLVIHDTLVCVRAGQEGSSLEPTSSVSSEGDCGQERLRTSLPSSVTTTLSSSLTPHPPNLAREKRQERERGNNTCA